MWASGCVWEQKQWLLVRGRNDSEAVLLDWPDGDCRLLQEEKYYEGSLQGECHAEKGKPTSLIPRHCVKPELAGSLFGGSQCCCVEK